MNDPHAALRGPGVKADPLPTLDDPRIIDAVAAAIHKQIVDAIIAGKAGTVSPATVERRSHDPESQGGNRALYSTGDWVQTLKVMGHQTLGEELRSPAAQALFEALVRRLEADPVVSRAAEEAVRRSIPKG